MDGTDERASLSAYLDAIFAAERCEQMPNGRWRCEVPLLAGWVAEGDERYQATSAVEKQVVAWSARLLLSGEPLPALGDLRPVVTDVVLPEIVTERLQLIPYTTRLLAAATFDRTALAERLGVAIHPEWPYPRVTYDDEEPEAAAPAELSLITLLQVMCVLRAPEIAPWEWLIAHTQDRLLIGEIGTTNPLREGDEDDNIQIGYSLVPEYQRQGYMTEAARAYVAWAFTHPELKWIYAMTETENQASRRVLEKLGARPFEEDDEIGWIDWELLPEAFVRAVSGIGQL
jgi:RimJ/RimL family protein N-acetyltransferase